MFSNSGAEAIDSHADRYRDGGCDSDDDEECDGDGGDVSSDAGMVETG